MDAKFIESKAIVLYSNNGNWLELSQMRGNFWRVMGCRVDGKDFLYMEEVLYLMERRQLLVKFGDEFLELQPFYESVIDLHLPMSCYMTYLKLKVIQSWLRCFICLVCLLFKGSV